jgi:UPF0716 family protein affecting phage T7 exclusion
MPKTSWVPFLAIPFAFGGWMLAETFVYGLISGQIGGLPTFILFVLKPVAGFMFLGQMLRRKFRAMATQAPNGIVISSLNGAGMTVLGAILVVLPGFLAGLIGLALLTPSVMGRWKSKDRPASPRELDLDATDWREIKEPKLPRKRKPPSDTI